MAQMVDTTSYWSIVPGLTLTALGLAATMTPATTAITGSLSRGQQGVASALNDTSREIGGALGIALMGSIFNAQYRTQVGDVAASLHPAQGKLVKEGIAGAVEVAQSMGRDGAPVLAGARQALVDAWASSMWIGAGLAVVAAGLVLGLTLGRKGREDMAVEGVLGDELALHADGSGNDANRNGNGTNGNGAVVHPEPALAAVGGPSGSGSSSG
jgi:hypothetical protein